MSGPAAVSTESSLFSRLRAAHVGLRRDLEVSRHVFRHEPAYVVRDPVTFQSQRLTHADYAILVRIDASRSLETIFAGLVEDGKLAAEDEQRFYGFILRLHRLGFLHLPLADGRQLLERHRRRQKARRRDKLMGFLFLRIPVWCPDAFLTRTVDGLRWLFSPAFFAFWLVIVCGACIVALRHWHELAEPLSHVVAPRNLPLMWVTLVVMKVIHEFGHAYACKHYGGHVPEMGVSLVVLTPCAYVDASACWGFTRKRDRVVVCLAGMYVEALVASVAVFAWASSEPSILKTLAYDTMVLAGAVTVLFNINPLMRYDGYYVLSDIVEVPNLRQRSNLYLRRVLKRLLLGVREAGNVCGVRLRAILLTYGIASIVYRTGLVVAIAAILAVKMGLTGVALGAFFLGGLLFGQARRLIRYLWFAEETAVNRLRAVGLGFATLVFLPAVLAFVPLPASVRAEALVSAEREIIVRTKSSGFVKRVLVDDGDVVKRGDRIVDLVNDELQENLAFAELQAKTAAIRREAYRSSDPARAQQAQAEYQAHVERVRDFRARVAALRLCAPSAGRIVRGVPELKVGTYLPEGAAVVTMVGGVWQAKALLTEADVATADLRPGRQVRFRPESDGSPDVAGVIAAVSPAATRHSIGRGAGSSKHRDVGRVATGRGREPVRPCFVVTVNLPEAGQFTGSGGGDSRWLRHGMAGSVRFEAGSETVARQLGRRFLRFWNRLLER